MGGCLKGRAPGHSGFAGRHNLPRPNCGPARTADGASRRFAARAGPARASFTKARSARHQEGRASCRRLAVEPHARAGPVRLDVGRALRRIHGRAARGERRQIPARDGAGWQCAQVAAGAARDACGRPGRGPDVHGAVLHPQRPEDDGRDARATRRRDSHTRSDRPEAAALVVVRRARSWRRPYLPTWPRRPAIRNI